MYRPKLTCRPVSLASLIQYHAAMSERCIVGLSPWWACYENMASNGKMKTVPQSCHFIFRLQLLEDKL